MTMAAEPPPINLVYWHIIELAAAMKVVLINQLRGCWEVQVDNLWWFAVNGHTEPMLCSRSDIPIDPFNAYVMFNGWPAFILSPAGGCGAAGEAANEDTLIAALQAATERAKATHPTQE